MARNKTKDAKNGNLPSASPALSRATRSTVNARRTPVGVASAQRRLADILPDLIYQKPPSPARATPLLPRAASAPSQTSAKAPPSRGTRPSGLTTDKAPEKLGRCKARPTNTRGSGGSRPFVPHCR